MEEILELFPNREAFEKYWEENYLPVEYKDVKSAYEEYVKSVDKHIFLADYEENGCIGESDFLENLSEDAQFFFQDTLTEIFYERNPDVYENAFALYEIAQMEGDPSLDVAICFHEEYNRLYREFMMNIFGTFFTK